MIELKLNISGTALASLKSLEKKMPSIVLGVYQAAAGAAHTEFTALRLSGRNGADMGLNRVTGTLAKAFMFSTNQEDGRVHGALGWIDAHSARIASVHELGTVGAGGTLKDIVPKGPPKLMISKLGNFWYRQPMLAFRTSSITPASVGKRGGKIKAKRVFSGWIYAKSVAIPPRLHFHDFMRSAYLQKQMVKAADLRLARMVNEVPKSG